MRVYQLAKTLGVESKELLDYCKELGYDIKNQLSNLNPDQCDALTQRVKQGPQGGVAVATAPIAPPVLSGHITSKVKNLTHPARPAPAAAPPPRHDRADPTPRDPPATGGRPGPPAAPAAGRHRPQAPTALRAAAGRDVAALQPARGPQTAPGAQRPAEDRRHP